MAAIALVAHLNLAYPTIVPTSLVLTPTGEYEREPKGAAARRTLDSEIEYNENVHRLTLVGQLEQYSKTPMSSYMRPDNASLHFTPTYVHRKSGVAHSITTATVCLIHPAYWAPSNLHIHPRAPARYQPEHQLVSELMGFGKQELGSVGVKESSSDVSEND
ncbi:hypothetical protein K488DRAFT_89886 [Vararia minispora EC-137]|uniref:Uncharacterized protein n=1 Tax=Vararia minispora EC-137 TaxID=1314806 RepID=A0ACB8Q919_9AGAM|nr:hypothetical protein K488DRAFT_89886 [Vararia minispora EC-137]